MKIALISFSDSNGGAADACVDIHKNFNKNKISSSLILREKKLNIKNSILFGNRFINTIRNKFIYFFMRLIGSNNFSLNILPSNLNSFLKYKKFDLINCHWINGETISLDELKKIKIPIIFTLHDEWLLLGGQHYKNSINFKKNKILSIFEKRLIRIKKKLLKKENVFIVAPSVWLYKEALRNKYIDNKRVFHIPYYFPDINQIKKINLNKKNKIKLFFSVSGYISNKRKGFQYIEEFLKKNSDHQFELNVLSKDKKIKINDKRVNHISFLPKKKYLRLLNNMDGVLIPSTADNFPNTAIEALSCRLPILSFDIGGLKDLIKHKKNGYLIKKINYKNFDDGMKYFLKNLENMKHSKYFSKISKKYTKNKINQKYTKMFKEIINN